MISGGGGYSPGMSNDLGMNVEAPRAAADDHRVGWALPSVRLPLWPPAAWPVSWRAVSYLVAGFVSLVAISTLLGWVVTEFLAPTRLGTTEADLSAWLERRRTPTLDRLTHIASFVGDSVPKTILLWTMAVTLVAVYRRLDLAAFVVATLELQRTVYVMVRGFIGRARPDVEHLDVSPANASFPSGHAASATVLALAVWLMSRQLVRSARVRRAVDVLVPVWIVGMATIRVYRGMHYATDVVAGIALGAAATVIGVVVTRRAVADAVERVEHRTGLGCRAASDAAADTL